MRSPGSPVSRWGGFSLVDVRMCLTETGDRHWLDGALSEALHKHLFLLTFFTAKFTAEQ